MLNIRPIASLDLPELEPYRTMRRPQDHCDRGIFVAEGDKVVRRLLESQFQVVSVLLPEKHFASFEPLLQSRPESPLDVFITPIKVLEQLVGFPMYQGVLAVGRIPRRAQLQEVVERSPQPRLFAALDGLTSAENVGVIVRNCLAFGAHALLLDGRSCNPFLRRAVRNSMGAVFGLPIVEETDLSTTLAALRKSGFRIVGAHPREDGSTLWKTDLRGDCCLVFGSEGYGLSAGVLRACDSLAAIPMAAGVDSLNVNAAAAVFLCETLRQRQS